MKVFTYVIKYKNNTYKYGRDQKKLVEMENYQKS